MPPAVVAAVVVGGAAVAAGATVTTAVVLGTITVGAYVAIDSMLPTPELNSSPTYSSDIIRNTSKEGVYVARCYGTCKIGGNKIRYNDPDDADIRIIVGHCIGPISNIGTIYINDIAWGDLNNSNHTKSEYTGTRAQTQDSRFTSRASAYRSLAYTAFTFKKQDQQVGDDPNVTALIDGLLCAPLAGGADAFTRNPAVVLYDWYLNVEGYSSDDLDTPAFQSLEELCDEVPDGGTIERFRFDFNFDTNMSIEDAKKIIWQSFNGRSIISQGKIKPVWDSGRVADGAGSLTAKTIVHNFTEDNIVEETFTWKKNTKPNLVRIYYKDSGNEYETSSVEEKDQIDIRDRGENLLEEQCYFITDAEVARRRAKFKFNLFKYSDYTAVFSAFSDSSDLELYDLVTITHTLPGWSSKEFIIVGKDEDEYGRTQITARAYYAGVYDDAEVADQPNYSSTLPNPRTEPPASTNITASIAAGTNFKFDAVEVSFDEPATDPFYSYSEIYASKDDVNYKIVGTSSGDNFIINGIGTIYEVGDTCYIKLVSVNELGVKQTFPVAADDSIVIPNSILMSNFYCGDYDFWGGNSDISNAATVIVIGNLDGTPKIALGASADAITFAGNQSGFIVDGSGNMRCGDATNYMKWTVATSTLAISGTILANAGAIGGWNITNGYLYSLGGGTPTAAPNDGIVFASFNPKIIIYENTEKRIQLGYLDAGIFGIIGYEDDGNTKAFEMSDTQIMLAGWSFDATTLSSANITIDSGNDKITVNTITIDGANDRIRSSNYEPGPFGTGFTLEPDLLEVGNIAARGIIRTAVFQKDVISAVGGSLAILPSDVLSVDMTASDSSTLTIEGNETFSAGDILRIKEDTDDEWLQVISAASAPTYSVARDRSGNYAANNNPAWKKGVAVVNYRQSGDGAIYMTSTAVNAPTMLIFTHSGSPWSDSIPRIQLGNIEGDYGIKGYEDDGSTVAFEITDNQIMLAGWDFDAAYLWTLASGTPTASPSDGMVFYSTNPSITIYENTEKRVEVGYLSAGVYGIKGYEDDGSTVIFELSDSQKMIAGWTISETTLANSTNIVLDADNKLIGIKDTTFGNDGIQLDYNGGSPQIYAGDGANEFFKYTTAGGVQISTSQSTGIQILGGGDITLTGHDTNAGKVIFEGSSFSSSIYASTTGSTLNVLPGTTDAQALKLGDGTYRFDYVQAFVDDYVVFWLEDGNHYLAFWQDFIEPYPSNNIDIGASTNKFKDAYLSGTLYADTIAESTAATGVTIDGVQLKDYDAILPSGGGSGSYGSGRVQIVYASGDMVGITLSSTRVWDIANIVSASPDYFGIRDSTAGAYRFKIDENGICIMPAVYSHDMNGETIRDLQINDSGELGYDSSWLRAKMNIEEVKDLSWFFKLRIVEYDIRKKSINEDGSINYLDIPIGNRQIGLIAEEVAEIKPELVYFNDDDEPTGIHHKGFIPPLIAVVQELNNKVGQLKKEIELLKGA